MRKFFEKQEFSESEGWNDGEQKSNFFPECCTSPLTSLD
jgi:hypothetical protein